MYIVLVIFSATYLRFYRFNIISYKLLIRYIMFIVKHVLRVPYSSCVMSTYLCFCRFSDISYKILLRYVLHNMFIVNKVMRAY